MADEGLLALAVCLKNIATAAERELAGTLGGDWAAIAIRQAIAEVIRNRDLPARDLSQVTELLTDLWELLPIETVTVDLITETLELPFERQIPDEPF